MTDQQRDLKNDNTLREALEALAEKMASKARSQCSFGDGRVPAMHVRGYADDLRALARLAPPASEASDPAPAVEREAVRESIEACIAGGGKQTDVAPLYAQAIRQLDSRSPEWTRINDAITARWPKGLDRVKKLAWEVV